MLVGIEARNCNRNRKTARRRLEKMAAHELTKTQQAAVDHLRAIGGALHRWPGGYWTTEQMPASMSKRVPGWYVGTPTVAVLEKAGVIAPVTPRSDWSKQHFKLVGNTGNAS